MMNAQGQQEAGFSANIITRLKHNGYISLESVESICRVLNCGGDDILEFVPENNGKEDGWDFKYYDVLSLYFRKLV